MDKLRIIYLFSGIHFAQNFLPFVKNHVDSVQNRGIEINLLLLLLLFLIFPFFLLLLFLLLFCRRVTEVKMFREIRKDSLRQSVMNANLL